MSKQATASTYTMCKQALPKLIENCCGDAKKEVLEFCEILLFCFGDLEDQSLTDIVSYIIFCLEIFPEMSYYLYSTRFQKLNCNGWSAFHK